MSGEETVCAQCARKYPTCCRITKDQTEYLFPLSDREINSILIHYPDRSIFSAEAENTEDFLIQMRRLFPADIGQVNILFPLKAGHNRLVVDEGGNCVFLGAHGCRLPWEARPLYCRLFPFWVVQGRIALFQSKQCEAQTATGSLNAVMRRLHINKKDIIGVYRELRSAWGVDQK